MRLNPPTTGAGALQKSSTMNYLKSLIAPWYPLQSSAEGYSSLCQTCKGIFQGPRRDKPLGVTAENALNQTLEELQFSAENGCHLCHIRWNDLSTDERSSLIGCKKVTYGFWKHRVGDGIAFEYFYAQPLGKPKPCLTRSVLLKPVDEASSFAMMKDYGNIETNRGDEYSIHIAQSWVENCLKTHPYCNRTLPIPQKRIMPSRLIDIGADSNVTPRLCSTEGLPLDTKYVTLSHCWGSRPLLMLTKANEETFLKQIDVKTLPKTFKDAMRIAASLGQRYIWIDSLCIVQDSPQDWDREAAIMGDVYHNSWCNIAATAAVDSTGGCFMERSRLDVLPCKIQAKWTSEPKDSFICSSLDLWNNGVENSVLNQRGWVCQEVVLAPRVVHFAKHQMFWECLELRACETYPLGLPNNSTTKMSLDVYCLRNDLIQARSMTFKRYQLWALFVNDYSRRMLSKPELDKLIAISGLARKLIGDGNNYVAGLWKEILPYQLMWTADSSPEQVPGNPDIPSWSWASLNKRVYTRPPHEGAESSILIRVASVNVTLLKTDLFGQVKGGLISIEGPLVKVIFRPCIGMYMNKKSWLGTSLASVYPDRGPLPDGSTVYCSAIEANRDGSKFGLVLEPVATSRGLFRRLGYFAVFDLTDTSNWVGDFDELQQSPLEPDAYEEILGLDSKSGFLFYRFSIK